MMDKIRNTYLVKVVAESMGDIPTTTMKLYKMYYGVYYLQYEFGNATNIYPLKREEMLPLMGTGVLTFDKYNRPA